MIGDELMNYNKKLKTFYLTDECLKAAKYLSEKKINMSRLVSKALSKEKERQELIKIAFPDD
jgi:post-segregation antitoxin (ccd killing protein)